MAAPHLAWHVGLAEFVELPARLHSPLAVIKGEGLECRVRAGRGLNQHLTFNNVGGQGIQVGGRPGELALLLQHISVKEPKNEHECNGQGAELHIILVPCCKGQTVHHRGREVRGWAREVGGVGTHKHMCAGVCTPKHH